VSETTTHALCPNANCSALVHFAFFGDRDSADSFDIERRQWYTTSTDRLADSDRWMVSYFGEPILDRTPSSLCELVSEEILQSIQAGFADYLGGPFTLFEVSTTQGHRRIEPLPRTRTTKGVTTTQGAKFRNFTKFCERLRTLWRGRRSLGDMECHRTDCQVIDEVLASGRREAAWHICWCGFVEFTAPVTVNG